MGKEGLGEIFMERLSHKDILALNNAIGDIYAARDMGSFYKSAFSSVFTSLPTRAVLMRLISPFPLF